MSEKKQLFYVQLLDKTSRVPTRGSEQSAGWDLYSPEDKIIPSWKSRIIPLKIKILMPNGVYGRIASRSGLAVKHNIEVGAGVIDADYQGEIMVVLRNFSNDDYSIKKGDRIAQLILENYMNCDISECNNINDIVSVSKRGTGGFGSTHY